MAEASPSPTAATDPPLAAGAPRALPARDPQRTPLGVLVAYATPAFGVAFFLFFTQFYFLKYAADVLLLAPAVIGAIFGLGRIWDAVSDPIAGYWSDRTRSRIGRRRPWMLAGIVPLAAFFAMAWLPPQGLGEGALLAWSAVALFGLYTAFTVYHVPHQSLGAELSRDHHDRSRIFGFYHAAFTLGMIASFAGVQYMMNAAEPRAAALRLVTVLVLLVPPLLLVAPSLLRERAENQGRGSASPTGAVRDVLRNVHARRLLALRFIEAVGMGTLGVLGPFLAEYVMRRPDRIAVISGFFVGAVILSIPVWVALSKRFGKQRVWLVALWIAALAFGATFFVPPDGLTVLCVLLLFAGFGSGCAGVIGPSMLADVIDYDEYVSGERKEGAYSAAWGFALKLAIGLMIMVSGAALQLAGFAPNQEQSETTQLVVRAMFAGLPFSMLLLGAWVLSGFGLDQAEHGRLRRELDERSAARSS